MGLEILGRKLGMTQIFTDSGDRVPVTIVKADPCTVVQKKTPERDGYFAVQLGYGAIREKHVTRALKGHFERGKSAPKRVLFEVRISPDVAEGLEPGQEIRGAEQFQAGQRVDVIGTTKGRGFTGVIKRWNFPRSKMTHGTHEFFRHGGSVGAGSFPGKIIRGLRMAGHYGNERVTTLRLRVEKVDAERGLLYLRGAVPGHRNALVRVRASARA